MKQQIPKPARDLLAREPANNVHPSPDLLNGYLEHALSDAEKTGVVAHLAACADCRDIVFLAGGAVEEKRWVAAAAAAMPSPSRRRWFSWKWAGPVTAVLIVAAAVIVEHDQLFSPRGSETRTVAMSAPVAAPHVMGDLPSQAAANPGSPSSARSFTLSPSAAPATPAGTQAAQSKPHAAKKRAGQQVPVLLAQQKPTPVPARAVPAQPDAKATGKVSERGQTALSQTVAVTSAAPLVQNAPNGGNDLTYINPATPKDLQSGFAGKSEAAANEPVQIANLARRGLGAQTTWRITSEGHVEHLAAGSWTRVLTIQPVSFHAVAATGNSVWAGGNDGALFHSADAGQHWDKVALTSDGQPEQGTVVSIRFDTVQKGTIRTDSGTTWTTSDGGQSWSKQ